jgi:hypothetical protein
MDMWPNLIRLSHDGEFLKFIGFLLTLACADAKLSLCNGSNTAAGGNSTRPLGRASLTSDESSTHSIASEDVTGGLNRFLTDQTVVIEPGANPSFALIQFDAVEPFAVAIDGSLHLPLRLRRCAFLLRGARK